MCVCVYVFVRVWASISWKLLRTSSLARCIPCATLSWIDAHFSIFAIKRPCRRGVDAKERNYMDHFDGKKREEGKRIPMERPGSAIAACDGDFQRKARWLNKLCRSSSVFFFFPPWIIYKRISTSFFLICRFENSWLARAVLCSFIIF